MKTAAVKAAEPQATPVMQQYLELKSQYADCLLFYRMGDFYELFFEDAVDAAAILDIALTKRGQHAGEEIPMCGVPVHSHENYLERLIASGRKVAICEQLETPEEAKKRGYKAVLKRDVVRVVTPGTITEERLLNARASNFLAAIAMPVVSRQSSVASMGITERGEAAQAVGVAGGGFPLQNKSLTEQVRGGEAVGESEARGRIPPKEEQASLAWVDISTGEFWLQPCALGVLKEEILRLAPSELLLADGTDAALVKALQEADLRLSFQPLPMFSSSKGEQALKAQYQLSALDALGSLSRADLAAAAALLEYLNLTQRGAMPRLNLPRRIEAQGFLAIDPATLRNLEVMQTLTGQRKGSLLAAMDETVTAAGGRLLARRLSQPLTDPARIARRLDAVEYFRGEMDIGRLTEQGEARSGGGMGVRPPSQGRHLREKLRALLKTCPDVERSLSRLCLERGGPRDLQAIAKALEVVLQLRLLFSNAEHLPEAFVKIHDALPDSNALRDELKRALTPEVPLLARDGGFVAAGYHAALDEFRLLRDESRRHIAALQNKYSQETGIASLKIKHNNVLGYFVEISANHASKMREPFFHRQTLANVMRYSSKDLAELEQKLSEAGDRAIKIEWQIYEQLVEQVRAAADSLALAAHTIAGLDVAAGLAELAARYDYCRPELTSGDDFCITGGRHPVVEQALTRDGQQFIANDCLLQHSSPACGGGREGVSTQDILPPAPSRKQEGAQGRLWLLTGPNMAGKSTFLRQNALIALMAQMGSFVPATSAKIGVVDRVFSRVGAADDLARGRSTFMVEMVETATILTQATSRSLVILDEIGRGTATYDGLAIAWAVVEHLHDMTRCRGLFATHYHELTQLCGKLASLASYHLKVKEWKGEVIFLHSVAPGAADRSYGIHVAKLAGLPASVTARADVLLKRFESDGSASLRPAGMAEPLPLFAHAAPAPTPQPSAAEQQLTTINPDELSPKEALEVLYRLKGSLS